MPILESLHFPLHFLTLVSMASSPVAWHKPQSLPHIKTGLILHPCSFSTGSSFTSASTSNSRFPILSAVTSTSDTLQQFSGVPSVHRFGGKSTAEEVTEGISLDSKVAIVTGGSSGIGYETVRVLAKRGCQVVIACENLKSANKARDSILQQNPNAKIIVLHLNLSSMYSVRHFVDKFKSLELPLHILINNAGIATSHFTRSEDGLEMTFAVNHVGHFLLTNLLLDLMDETAKRCGGKGRIVVVASSQHDSASGINFAKLNEKSWMFSVPILQSVYGLSTVYAQSKLANILHAKELSRRLQERGMQISVNALHPGVFNTSFVKQFAEPAGLMFSWIEPFLKTVEQGAATTCYLAAHPSVEGVTGKYFSECKESRGNKHTNDMNLAKELWEYSEKLVE